MALIPNPLLAFHTPVQEITLQEQVESIIETYPVDKQTVLNLIESESSWNPKEYKNGDRGLFQISEVYHSEVSDECTYDPLCATKWSLGRIADGHIDEWVVCNCVLTMKARGYALPKMENIIPNHTPQVGVIAIFMYGKTKHIAEVIELTEKGFYIFEGNYTPCKIGKRFITWNDKHLKGFFMPDNGG